ncbi:hypothetical protein [Hyphococcus sp.]|uniref:hypothetical protein n=1 Tax=Hyphococcus sp. TaxID=2038636 RepID=UPI003D14EE4D
MMAFTAGCAVNPISSQSSAKHQAVAERDLLAEAARQVESAPWPKPEPVSFVSRITVGAIDDDGFTKTDAAETYAAALQPAGARFQQLEADASANLKAAERLLDVAETSLAAARLTGNDVALVEEAIQALRENRQIYVSAAHQIEKLGETVDDDRLDAIRDAYNIAIRDLGEAANALADRLDHDRSENYASPAKPRVNNLSGV